MEYYSAIKKNAFESVLMRWMKLKPIIQWSKPERITPNIVYKCIYMEFRKMVMITLYARQQKRRRCPKQSFWLWERARSGGYGRMALKHINYHMWNRLPVQVWCMLHCALGCCTGMTHRDGMRKEEGGVSGWGMQVYSWLIHVSVWQNHYSIIK